MAVNVTGQPLEYVFTADTNPFQEEIKRIEASLNKLTGRVDEQSKAIEGYARKATAALAAYASFTAGSNFVSDIVRVRGEFQQLEVAFNTMLGSKEKADKLLAEVTQFAATTPFGLQEVAAATKQLLAFGIESEKINGTLRSLGDVSAGIGQPLGEIAYLFGTIKTQGVALTQDVRQFAQRGIPIYEELAKVLNVSTKEVGAFITAGKVGFPEIERAFISMTAEGSKFGGLMEEQSKTLTGQISNLQDAWAQMLNEIGRSNEGVFAGAISAATKLVENYETVLDILKVLVLTYGSYKAAIVTTTAVQAIATNVTKGYTIAETLRYQAMLLSEKAMKLLNATMLSNPAVAVATGITALVSAFIIFRKEAKAVKSATELLNTAQKNATENYNNQKAKLLSLTEILKQSNITEQRRLDIYNQLKAIDPQLIKNIDAKSLSYKDLKNNVDAYLVSLDNRLRMEANEEAIKASKNRELEIADQIKALEKQVELEKKREERTRTSTKILEAETTFAAKASATASQQLEEARKNLKKQQDETKKIASEGASITPPDEEQARTVAFLEKQISDLKETQKNVSTTSAKYKEYTAQIKVLEKELEAITGKDAAKKALKDAKDRNKELQDLLKDISKAEEDARRSGLTKEETEIDKINARYSELAKRAQEFKNNAGLLQRIENARSEEAGNQRQREQFEEYKRFIKNQQDVFDQFEEYKLQVGEQKARELTDFQTGEFTDVIEALKVQLALVSQDLSLSGKLKKDFLVNTIAEAEKEKVKREADKQAEEIQRIITESQTAAQKRLQIEEKYLKDVQVLQEKYTGQELQERVKVLKEAKDEDLRNLTAHLAEQGKAYRALNQDLVRFTKERIDQEIANLKKLLDNENLDAGTRKAIESAIKNWEKAREQINDTSLKELIADVEVFAEKALQVGAVFIDLGRAMEGVNDGLADTLTTIGEIANIAGTAAAGIAQIGSGQVIQGIGSLVKSIAGIFTIGKKARESERRAQQEIEAFTQQLLRSEQEINLVYRERQREQEKLNKLKLDGLRDERKLLEEHKKLNEDQFQQVLKQLQAESAIVGKTTEQYGGFLGIGKKTRSVDIVESLAGRSFDELEQLFLKGQLEGKAKELFELLQRIKQEGADIDRLLAENAEAAKEAFTGTTADSITDSIIEGFRNGMRSARDFADNFEQLMKNAVLQSIKLQALEGPLNDFFDEFAAASESDSLLTQAEIDQLNAKFSSIIENAGRRFEELQRITNLDFSSDGSTGSAKSLTGAIRGITEQQAELLAGQFGGLRLTALDQLKVAGSQLTALQAIQNHTSNLLPMYQLWQRIELHGIKMK